MQKMNTWKNTWKNSGAQSEKKFSDLINLQKKM